MVELVFGDQVRQFQETIHFDIGTVIEDANLLGTQVFNQVLPFGQHVLSAAGAPFLGHDALRTESTAIGTSARREHTEAPGPINGVGGWLQIGVAIHFEDVIGRPGKAI